MRSTPAAIRVLRKSALTKNGCWEFGGTKTREGYGIVSTRSKPFRVCGSHRVVYEYATATTIPPKMVIDHLCRNPSCVNPQHMEVVTSGENVLRGYRAKRAALEEGS